MKKVTAYKCDFCSKVSMSAGAIGMHMLKCKSNPNNRHKCFDYCTHLKRIAGYPQTEFICKKLGIRMYSFKAVHTSINTSGLRRMPLECKHHAYMTDSEMDKRFNI